jgi:hypothetical protein
VMYTKLSFDFLLGWSEASSSTGASCGDGPLPNSHPPSAQQKQSISKESLNLKG